MSRSRRRARARVGGRPNSSAIAAAVPAWSPVIILTSMPALDTPDGRDCRCAEGRPSPGGRRSVSAWSACCRGLVRSTARSRWLARRRPFRRTGRGARGPPGSRAHVAGTSIGRRTVDVFDCALEIHDAVRFVRGSVQCGHVPALGIEGYGHAGKRRDRIVASMSALRAAVMSAPSVGSPMTSQWPSDSASCASLQSTPTSKVQRNARWSWGDPPLRPMGRGSQASNRSPRPRTRRRRRRPARSSGSR